jgi:hypothetical protein
MSAREYLTPALLREAVFVRWQAPGRREPARVSGGAIAAASLSRAEYPGQRNIYPAHRWQGLPWSPGLDAQIRLRGGGLPGHRYPSRATDTCTGGTCGTRSGPAHLVQLGPLARCHGIELRPRGTCPRSPQCPVCPQPDDVPVCPAG